jgi:uncharacterized membrane protein
MSFILFCLVLSAIAYVPQFFLGDRRDLRTALRHGLAGGFLYTGVDHFVHAQERYVPMIPDFLAGAATPLVYLSGAAEILGALGLVVPLALYRRLGLPDLRWWAGVGLAAMLVFLVVANVNVAVKGGSVPGLSFGPESYYYWLRPLLQPVIIAWALYAAGVWPRGSRGRGPVPSRAGGHGVAGA